jgi:hypothetical protein
MATDIMIDSKLALFANMADCLHNSFPNLVSSPPNKMSPSQTPKDSRFGRTGRGHMRSSTVGYIAPKFEGKQAQKLEGKQTSEAAIRASARWM